MRRQLRHWILGICLFGLLVGIHWRTTRPVSAAEESAGGSYEAEKAKASKSPYANDFGPKEIDVSSYPSEIQNTYKNVFLVRCQRCHTAARPLNSQFLEPYSNKGEKEARRAEKEAKLAEWKTKYPEISKDKLVWQAETQVWERYVKKMMSKPGCNISSPEGKKIWEFLTYDSEHRKVGANTEKWAAHRRKLLDDFKASNPARYRELYETQ